MEALERAVPPTNFLLAELRNPAVPESPADPEFRSAVENLLNFPFGRGLRVGDVLDDYRLVELLGEGGMGVVYRAVHTRLEKEVALKVIRHTRTVHPQAVERFQREMKAAGKNELAQAYLFANVAQYRDELEASWERCASRRTARKMTPSRS